MCAISSATVRATGISGILHLTSEKAEFTGPPTLFQKLRCTARARALVAPSAGNVRKMERGPRYRDVQIPLSHQINCSFEIDRWGIRLGSVF